MSIGGQELFLLTQFTVRVSFGFPVDLAISDARLLTLILGLMTFIPKRTLLLTELVSCWDRRPIC